MSENLIVWHFSEAFHLQDDRRDLSARGITPLVILAKGAASGHEEVVSVANDGDKLQPIALRNDCASERAYGKRFGSIS